MKDLPAFLRDTDFSLYLRSYYFNRENPDVTQNEAWAFGGWAAYRSGWLFDLFQIGATVYGSAPLYAPEDKDGTTLLKPGQEGYGVLGEAFAALRYKDYAVAKGYRAGGLPGLHQPPGQPDDAQHLRGCNPRREAAAWWSTSAGTSGTSSPGTPTNSSPCRRKRGRRVATMGSPSSA